MPGTDDLPTIEEVYPRGTPFEQADRVHAVLVALGFSKDEIEAIESGRLAPDTARWMVVARAKRWA